MADAGERLNEVHLADLMMAKAIICLTLMCAGSRVASCFRLGAE